MPTPPKRSLSASISGPRKSAIVARFRPGGPPVSQTVAGHNARQSTGGYRDRIEVFCGASSEISKRLANSQGHSWRLSSRLWNCPRDWTKNNG